MNERVNIFLKLVAQKKAEAEKVNHFMTNRVIKRRRKRLKKTVEELYPRGLFSKIYACSAHEYGGASEENAKMTLFLDLARLVEDGKIVKYRNSKFEIVYEPVRVLSRKNCVSDSKPRTCEEDDSAE